MRAPILFLREYKPLNCHSSEPSMFGRELTEQVRADSKLTDKMAPLLVEKCITAVDATGKPLSEHSSAIV